MVAFVTILGHATNFLKIPLIREALSRLLNASDSVALDRVRNVAETMGASTTSIVVQAPLLVSLREQFCPTSIS
ncbi:hypothetical protein Y032_0134g1848 [Ancylostoma ceylanicum]|uniref:Uncharacterized protein n=1 Tax=Ancylostoma ceylanicum TaxID=53326 RepID=A0A016T569_9BILA|nr:hypothetical protein Y032_0134g1848 [Ancylostoma ceylanicum]